MNKRLMAMLGLALLLSDNQAAFALYDLKQFVPDSDYLLIDSGGTSYPADADPTPLPAPDPAPPTETVPTAPAVRMPSRSLDTITLAFRDKSDIEAGFALYRSGPNGVWENLGSFGPIENSGPEYFIIDGPEDGFSVWPIRAPAQDDKPVYLVSDNPLAYTTYYRPDLESNTEYCYRLVPFGNDGAVPEFTPTVCGRTNLDLKPDTFAGEISTSADPAPNSLGIDVEPYDIATLVKDREGLLGELEGNWAGKKLIYVHDNANIDMSGYRDLPLKRNLTLKSGRGTLIRGALISTTWIPSADEDGNGSLFVAMGNHITVSGLRLRGPSGNTNNDLSKNTAIKISLQNVVDQDLDAIYDQYGDISGYDIDVLLENNEFYQWPHAAIWLKGKSRATVNAPADDPNFCMTDPLPAGIRWITWKSADSVRITRNFLHHNQRDELGYGIQVAHSAYALIDRNTFDYNRHAIASDGRLETGYVATLNLVLGNGGKYCNNTLDYCNYEHHFDMHGRCGGSDSSWDSGPAGEYVNITQNTFRGSQGYGLFKNRLAFKIRGDSSRGVFFTDNTLEHKNEEEAILDSWGENDIYTRANANDYDVDTRFEFGAGDFDGDGKDDVFLATGSGWYYSSGARTEWRFLNDSAVRLDELVLHDYDGDGRTDVLRKNRGSWSASLGGVTDWIRDIGYSPTKDQLDANRSSVKTGPVAGSIIATLNGDFDGNGTTEKLTIETAKSLRFLIDGKPYSWYDMVWANE